MRVASVFHLYHFAHLPPTASGSPATQFSIRFDQPVIPVGAAAAADAAVGCRRDIETVNWLHSVTRSQSPLQYVALRCI